MIFLNRVAEVELVLPLEVPKRLVIEMVVHSLQIVNNFGYILPLLIVFCKGYLTFLQSVTQYLYLFGDSH